MLAIAKSTGSVRARAASAVLQQYGRQRQYPQIGYYHAKQHNYHYQKNNSRSTLQHGFHTVAQAYSRQQQENEDTHARYNHNAIIPQQQQQQMSQMMMQNPQLFQQMMSTMGNTTTNPSPSSSAAASGGGSTGPSGTTTTTNATDEEMTEEEMIAEAIRRSMGDES
mmetsp:Transcript_19228/g.29624  ORF Transcript_19228/g.29624 Transcript_19228/m.29624 type:complete len:166 (-) Transcript_19228:235-732(-)